MTTRTGRRAHALGPLATELTPHGLLRIDSGPRLIVRLPGDSAFAGGAYTEARVRSGVPVDLRTDWP